LNQLILFDFDGTITTKDTLLAFTKYAIGGVRFSLGLILLSPVLIIQKMGLVSAQKTKEIFLSYYFKGMPLVEFDQKCSGFVEQSLSSMIRPGALAAIKGYIKNGDRVIVVSASPQNWITPWADPLGAEVLSTQLEIKSGRLTGNILGKNCNGVEKVSRIKKHLSLESYSHIIAYGDTSGDKEMLALAGEKYYKPFR
jgi:phosphatidylglycerophosphatase C